MFTTDRKKDLKKDLKNLYNGFKLSDVYRNSKNACFQSHGTFEQ